MSGVCVYGCVRGGWAHVCLNVSVGGRACVRVGVGGCLSLPL